MSPEDISKALFKVFNDEGLEVKGFKIKSKSPLVANIHNSDEKTIIKFGENYPKAEITRIITLYAYIEEIVFGKDGGSIKLKNFPDIHFAYSDSVLSLIKENFGDSHAIDCEIDKKYSCPSENEIAKKCLQYANEWATICSQAGVDFSESNHFEKQELRRSCYNFVKDNVEEEAKEKYKSVFLTFILVTIILPAIISWVVGKILDELFG
jgi:hypothetical protein